MVRTNILSSAAVLLWVVLAATGPAQTKAVQQLGGDYAGLASIGTRGETVPLLLAIMVQDNRSFSGLLPYIEQDNLLVKGTIAASGECTIQASSEDNKVTLSLDWFSAGGGGAVLSGSMMDGSVKNPVVFLRPFDALGVNWIEGQYAARLANLQDGTSNTATFQLYSGSKGSLLAILSIGDIAWDVIGTSDTGGQVLMAGVSGSLLMTVTAQVKINEHGESVLEGSYLLTSASGKLVDSGIIAILIG